MEQFNHMASSLLNGKWLGFKGMDLNPVTLSFRDFYEQEFLDKYFHDSIVQFRLAFALIIVLYCVFGVLDSLMVPELRQTFFIIRFVVVVPFLAIVLILSFFGFFKKIWQLLLLVSFVVAGLGITVMLVLVPENYAYYAGMMLIFSAGYFFIKLRFFYATIAGWFTLICYNLGAFMFSDAPVELIINNNFFYVSANIIGMFAAYNIEYFARRDFSLNHQLDIRKDELEDLNQNLERKVKERTFELSMAKERAEQSDKLKSAFLANMSHEIRTPMNSILGFSQLLMEAEDEEELKEFVEVINTNGQHLLALINDIIDLSKVESGLMTMNTSEFSINDLVEEVANLFRSHSKAVSGRIEFRLNLSLDDNNAIFVSDRTRLKQVLINLLSNAFKFTNKGFVEVGYCLYGEYLLFYVKDTGIGLDAERRQVIFDRFMQATLDHQPKYEGFGLGLAISKAFVNLMEGEIWVDSSASHGSTFLFTLPFKEGSRAITKNRLVNFSNMETKWSNKVILVAEDVESNFRLIKSALKKTGVRLIWAQNGKEAIDACRKERDIDLVLMDVRMPVMNGYTATREIKKLCPDLPVIAQTSYAMNGDADLCIKAGCDAYISKPFNMADLFDVLAQHI